jgi:hypothetical protein
MVLAGEHLVSVNGGPWRSPRTGHRVSVNGEQVRQTRSQPPWTWPRELIGRRKAKACGLRIAV